MNESIAQPRGRRLRLRDERRKESETEVLAWYERQTHVVKCSRPARSPEPEVASDPEQPREAPPLDRGRA